jgi:hypothetical protein
MKGDIFTCRLTARNLEILRNGSVIYDIPLEQLSNVKRLAFWWRQIAGKSWVTRELMDEIGNAICGRLGVK